MFSTFFLICKLKRFKYEKKSRNRTENSTEFTGCGKLLLILFVQFYFYTSVQGPMNKKSYWCGLIFCFFGIFIYNSKHSFDIYVPWFSWFLGETNLILDGYILWSFCIIIIFIDRFLFTLSIQWNKVYHLVLKICIWNEIKKYCNM